MTQKEKYIELSKQVKLPLAMQPWWLDIVSSENGKGWDAIVVEDEKGDIIGAMPYHYVKKLGLIFAIQPHLTQHMGIWMRHIAEGKSVSEYDSVACRIIRLISEEIDNRKIFYMNMKLGIDSLGLQALEWNGFLCRVRYTYIMKDIPNSEEEIISTYRENKRRLVKRALQNNLSVGYNEVSPSELYDLYQQQLHLKGETIFYPKTIFCRLFDEAIKRNQGGIISIQDQNRTIHSAGAYLLDAPYTCQEECTYINPKYKDDGSSTLLLVKMMMEAKRNGCTSFNKGGGINECMAMSYAGIGTARVAYVQVIKVRGVVGWMIKRMTK
ncbi:MAG: hypothetical protein Q4C30_01745 [Bacteroidia bacterium]|nr:hypothetical protein [Bacteroidia bacterium]